MDDKYARARRRRPNGQWGVAFVLSMYTHGTTYVAVKQVDLFIRPHQI